MPTALASSEFTRHYTEKNQSRNSYRSEISHTHTLIEMHGFLYTTIYKFQNLIKTV